jgi:hypothetical protein
MSTCRGPSTALGLHVSVKILNPPVRLDVDTADHRAMEPRHPGDQHVPAEALHIAGPAAAHVPRLGGSGLEAPLVFTRLRGDAGRAGR